MADATKQTNDKTKALVVLGILLVGAGTTYYSDWKKGVLLIIVLLLAAWAFNYFVMGDKGSVEANSGADNVSG